MDLLLHPSSEHGHTRPDRRGRLSTIGHGAALRAFAHMARKAGIRFMVIGGTFRDVAIRATSTRDIDVVLVDRKELDAEAMQAAGFGAVAGSPHAWRFRAGDRVVDLQIAALATSEERGGPFSVACRHATRRTVEGVRVSMPRVEDYVVLKLLAAAAERRRRVRDLTDVQYALEAYPARLRTTLSVAGIRARLRDLYEVRGERLKELVTLLRQVPRPGAR